MSGALWGGTKVGEERREEVTLVCIWGERVSSSIHLFCKYREPGTVLGGKSTELSKTDRTACPQETYSTGRTEIRYVNK